ncbi:MAG: MerR family transcriptional regulator [Candidimonas sp.]|nr:MAG: MerR family transcriptional regulator [Candidimonas sp.]
MEQGSETLNIGTFAKAAEVNVETIRFYQQRGLLPTPKRLYGGIRHYGSTDVARVKFAKSGQRLGFNLDEISEFLTVGDRTHCSEAAAER